MTEMTREKFMKDHAGLPCAVCKVTIPWGTQAAVLSEGAVFDVLPLGADEHVMEVAHHPACTAGLRDER